MKAAFVKHHYIPKFILRPFCFEEERTWVFDKRTREIRNAGISDIFMERNLYRDEANEDPLWIEKDFGVFENKASAIIRKMRDDDEILLSWEEIDLVELFFATLGFRSDRVKKSYKNATPELKALYDVNSEEELLDLWKRNLGHIVNCKSLKEVRDHSDIHPAIKLFMTRDVFGWLGKSLSVVERRGNEDFFLSDAYPTEVTFSSDVFSYEISGYSILPVSPQRAIILFADGIENVPASVIEVNKEIFKKPQLIRSKGLLKIHIEKVYETDVKKLNLLTYNATEQSIIFKDRDRVSPEKYSELLK